MKLPSAVKQLFNGNILRLMLGLASIIICFKLNSIGVLWKAGDFFIGFSKRI